MVNYPHLLFLTLTLPLCPLLAFALSLWLPQKAWRISATLAILGQLLATIAAAALFWIFLSPSPLFTSTPHTSETSRYYWNFVWLQLESIQFPIAFLLDPITAAMGLMVATVSLLVFIFSLGYMADDPNSGKFFTYLSLFTATMQGVVISNSLLLTFISWELVGLCSYLLIGFWHQKPAAAAAAKKAFLVTRLADIGFFLGILWMQAATGTLLLYNNGHGILETDMLNGLSSTLAFGTITLSNAIALLIFLGAAGKSGQFPLHIWLPDAMEGPTPVSALIHAATMVAAGVYLVIRLFPLFNAAQISPTDSTLPLSVVTWVGATTALFAALLAIGQYDIKRILAYSTISQLGFMMLAVGVGAPIAGLLHLLAHGIFKALLFLGAGSVIHGCNGEQDIRLMGGLRKSMPLTFLLYLIGTLSLAGFPILFCGFWTK
ncbi:MAG: NADH-quinone oxidoreductase subunit L, partial [Chthoniobacterales bacterium]|nr:NADH-quinone oxidoreductase subunit L [Chthoniobacterales bacterium]